MKKTILAVLALMFCWSAGFAQFPNMEYSNINPREIQKKLQRNEILPLNIWSLRSFNNKRILKENAKDSVKKHKNYVAYYNAAVINFTIETFDGSDVDYDLNDNETANVVLYATKAIAISPRTPDMYLLRGLARYRNYDLSDVNGLFYREHAQWIKTHKSNVREMLADFEKVEELNWKMAPYYEMAKLYKGLGENDKANACARKAAEADRALQAERRAAAGTRGAVRAGFKAGRSTRA